MPDELADIEAIGALVEPARRALYLFVASQPQAVSREQAARSVDVPLHSAKFHLDRLVDEGLLEVEFRRLSGRSGPGAGRPSKLYRRSSRQLTLSLPVRRYDLASEVLAAAVERSSRESVPIADAVRDTAAAKGRQLASVAAHDTGGSGLARTADVLAEHGYEPRSVGESVCLANCPFDRLASEHTDLVCGMNLALVGGVIEGLGVSDAVAELAPAPGLCCVRVTPRATN